MIILHASFFFCFLVEFSLSQQFTRTIQKNNNNASHRLNCIDIVALYSAYNINESMGSHVEVDGLLIEEDRGDVLSPEEISDLISKYSGHEIVKNVLECASLEELNEKASIANDRLHKLERSIKEHAKSAIAWRICRKRFRTATKRSHTSRTFCQTSKRI